jgi:hypothetical protein
MSPVSISRISRAAGGSGRRLRRKSYQGPSRGPARTYQSSAAVPAAPAIPARAVKKAVFREIKAAISLKIGGFTPDLASIFFSPGGFLGRGFRELKHYEKTPILLTIRKPAEGCPALIECKKTLKNAIRRFSALLDAVPKLQF